MIGQTPKKDLVVLVADLDAQNAIAGLLKRHEALGIRPIRVGLDDIFRHPQRDPGCYGDCENFLRGFPGTYHHALVIFDHHGCGHEGDSPAEIENTVEKRLECSGWSNRSSVLVLQPELEIWVWSDSTQVDTELGWAGRHPALRDWLRSQSLIMEGQLKPNDPKKAMQQALRHVNKPLSARMFENLATSVGLTRCQDRAFLKFKDVLQKWFKEERNDG